jgi:opacity protein-like surface antigen
MLALAGAAVMASTAALAADFPPPMQPPPVYAPPAPVETGGWYLRGDVGVGRQSFDHFDFTQTANQSTFIWPASWRIDQKDIGDTAFVGLGAGYAFNNWFRVDATGEYRISAKFKALGSYTEFCPNGRCFDLYDGQHQAVVAMVNAYIDLGTWWCVTPFIGAGVGGAWHRTTSLTDIGFISDGSTGFGFAEKDHEHWTFAWAVHAGLSYSVSNNLKLEFAYRYLNMGDVETAIIGCNSGGCAGNGPRAFYTLTNFNSSDFKLGMRWMLNYEPPAAPPPLMRRG